MNDFSINIATANGTGSQSANLIIMQTMFDMRVGSSGKNCDTCLPDFYFYYVNAFSRPITHGDAWLGKLFARGFAMTSIDLLHSCAALSVVISADGSSAMSRCSGIS